MSSINLSFGIDSSFQDSDILNVLDNYGFTDEKTTNNYQKWVRKGLDVIIIKFEKKVIIQGKENDKILNVIRDILEVEGVIVDPKNAEKLAKLFKLSHNTLFCMKCNSPSMLIKGEIEGLDIVFKMQCGHNNDMNPPIFMLTSRILPDSNILVNGNLSRCIDLGYFRGFEIVIPDFVTHVIDTLGTNKKAGASKEIERLQELEGKGIITIFNCMDGIELPCEEDFNKVEDDKILEIANLTNSILLTGDMNLKDKANLNKRPTIYIHPKDGNQIKIIHETRNE